MENNSPNVSFGVALFPFRATLSLETLRLIIREGQLNLFVLAHDAAYTFQPLPT